jgi:hypothetical protein
MKQSKTQEATKRRQEQKGDADRLPPASKIENIGGFDRSSWSKQTVFHHGL